MASAAAEWDQAARKVLVARKAGFGLPTACPTCLPVLLYLRMAQVPFDIHVDSSFPDADHIPYVEFGECVAFNNEKGGVIEYLKVEKIVDLNSKHPIVSYSDVLSTKAMVLSWLADALQYELWVVTDGSIAHDIYFSDLPWPIGKILHWKKTRNVKQLLGITKLNAAEKEEEIYQNASAAYDVLSTRLGDQSFLFDNSPIDVDALLLGHALFVLNALPDTSVLRSCLQKHDNLVNFAEHLKVQLLDVGSSAAGLGSSTDSSSFSTPRKRASSGQRGRCRGRGAASATGGRCGISRQRWWGDLEAAGNGRSPVRPARPAGGAGSPGSGGAVTSRRRCDLQVAGNGRSSRHGRREVRDLQAAAAG